MSGVDTRHIARDSLFLMADLRLDGSETTMRVKVRNLSNGGMMAEAEPQAMMRVQSGARLTVNLRNIGWTDGSVAWVHDNRFGIAFAHEVDASLARSRHSNPDEGHTPRFVRPSSLDPSAPDTSRLRKI